MERYHFSWNGRGRFAASVLLLAAACRESSLTVDASALQIRADVSPTEIAASASPADGRVQVVVSITNPRRQPVAVQLGGPPYKSGVIPAAETQGIGFGMRVLGADSTTSRGPTEWTWGQPTVNLGSRETLRHTFVLHVGGTDTSANRLRPGTYRIVTSFGRQEAAPVVLHVLP